MKGQLDEDILKLPFEFISIIRPGQLDGNRTEKRKAEKIALKVMHTINKMGLLKKYRPIQAKQVAMAMINASDKNVSDIYTLDKVFDLAH